MQLQNIFLLFLSFFSLNKSKVIKIKQTETKKEILSKINIDLLPSLDDLINELNLQHRRLNLIKMGVTETRHLLRFKNMDYQMMVIMLIIIHSFTFYLLLFHFLLLLLDY